MRRVPRLHVVTTREILERPAFVAAAASLLATGEVALHLRARGSTGRLLLETARALLERGLSPEARARGARVLVNDRVDVARMAHTGAHLPEAGLTPAQARTILGRAPLLGRSIHASPSSQDPGTLAEAGLLDYVFFGHVFETASKPGAPARGVAALARTAWDLAARGLPVIAIGGLTPGRIGEALAAGAHGVAAISGIWEDPDPARAAARYLEALESSCS